MNGDNYLFGESVSLIDFIKVQVFSLRVLGGNFSLLIVLCLYVSLLNGRQHSSLSSSSSLIAILFSNGAAQIDRQMLARMSLFAGYVLTVNSCARV